MAVAARKHENPYAAPDSSADELSSLLLKSRSIAILQRTPIWVGITTIVAMVGIGVIFADVNRPLTPPILLLGFVMSVGTGLFVTTWAVTDELKVTLLYLAVLLFQGFGIAGMLTGLVTREKSQDISEARTQKD